MMIKPFTIVFIHFIDRCQEFLLAHMALSHPFCCEFLTCHAFESKNSHRNMFEQNPCGASKFCSNYRNSTWRPLVTKVTSLWKHFGRRIVKDLEQDRF